MLLEVKKVQAKYDCSNDVFHDWKGGFPKDAPGQQRMAMDFALAMAWIPDNPTDPFILLHAHD